MVTDLASTPAALQATVTVYMLGLAIGFVPVGVTADAWERKRVLLTCLAVVVATARCRMPLPRNAFAVRKLTSVSGILGAAWGLAPVIAPAVGGVLVQYTTWRAVPQTLRNPVFGCFMLVFGLLAAARLAFGVAGQFLYPEHLDFQLAAYGAIALAAGAANLLAELACGYFAVRIGTRKLALSALALFGAGTTVLTVSGLTIGMDAWALTIGAAALALLLWATDHRRDAAREDADQQRNNNERGQP